MTDHERAIVDVFMEEANTLVDAINRELPSMLSRLTFNAIYKESQEILDNLNNNGKEGI